MHPRRSEPPPIPAPRQSEVRAKALPLSRMRSLSRVRGDAWAARLLDDFMRRRRICNSEFAECLDVSEVIIRRLRANDNAPIHLGDVLLLPRRTARLFIDELLQAIEEGHGE